jgi:hypothetical protein
MWLPSFSKLALAKRCAYPWTGRTRWPEGTLSPQASLGRRVAVASEQLHVWGDYDGERFAHAEAIRELIERERPQVTFAAAEQAMAWSDSGARWLPQEHPRDYSQVREGEMFGTPDVVMVRGGDVVVRDYKTGDRDRGRDPQDHDQLRALALCASRIFGRREVVVELCHVSESYAWVERATLGRWELDETAELLERIYATIERADADPRAGFWCHWHYCPLLTTCPIQVAREKQLAEAVGVAMRLTTSIESAAQASEQWDAVRALERALEEHKRAVQEYARHNVVERENGKRLGWHETRREVIDGKRALPLLQEMGLEVEAEIKVTKTAITAAAKAAGQPQAATLRALRDAGAVRESTFERFEEFKV